jgi:hypothetical protein
MSKNIRPSRSRGERQRALDVEISFLEGVVRRDESWVDALKMLADGYTRRGRIGEGLQVDQRLAHLCPGEHLVFYNLACSHSLAGQIEEAVAALDRAVTLGYHDFKWLGKDPDMANLRKSPRFQEFLARHGASK